MIDSHQIRIATLPAMTGWSWIVQGWYLLKANPSAIHLSVVSLFACMMTLSLFPVIGGVLCAAAMPALYLGVMTVIASRPLGKEKTGPKAVFSRFFSSFRHIPALKQLFMLGFIYGAALMFVFALSYAVDGAVALKFFADPKNKALLSVDRMVLLQSIALICVLYLPLALMFWIAPMLVGWHGQSITKALFFSAMACWRNKTVFLIYAAAWAVIFFVFTNFVALLASLIGSAALASIVLLISSIFLSVWLYCSFYASYASLVQTQTDSEKPLDTTDLLD